VELLDADMRRQAGAVIQACRDAGVRLVAVEASTGGLLTGMLTLIPGASAVVDRAVVVYSNESKPEILHVPVEFFIEHGSVSEPAARAMAHSGLALAPLAHLCVAVTGVEGPGGTSAAKPAGLVHLAAVQRSKPGVLHEAHHFGDIGRELVRRASVEAAFALVLRRLHEA